ncbi:SpvB/TcaC N-terminal domain-containing protein [Streptomyces sp. HD]|uniref:SpvB/TcaC N-terminal domain-containing protein n=1 Tax=Streptomyces sp. HD TaxID=3020892 RepID=UPI00232D326D|nr:SpvB/TcaC N-terminal domain-containing protein [Streptomyces sp. HD]MDC0769104.1 SpvB/TcaC N-terminal domain-containing protein [Streptomyces sp. HD]
MPPAITLPKGGGAVRGIGEKFSANPVTGTGSLTVPLPATPGRSGFGPSLSLTYDSGAGHGPFGLGWSVGLPAVTRKTDKGMPTYDDARESDVFLLSGAEDLVPVLGGDGLPERRRRMVDGIAYRVTRYRPRIEGLFARIERWTHTGDGTSHWRSISRDNITTVYGRDRTSRIADPADPDHRVFSWLICESYDALGNAIVYGYVSEDDRNVDRTAAHECDRPDAGRTANRYLKSVRYGNKVSRLADPPPERDPAGGWHFELVFDYGDHAALPPPGEAPEPGRQWPTSAPRLPWPCRNDPFSTYRAGFEVRSYRLCRRILMFHHFEDEPEVGADCLVRSLALTYRGGRSVDGTFQPGDRAGAVLESATLTGYRPDGANGYVCESMPPLEFTYSSAQFGSEVHELDAKSVANLPVGLDVPPFRWVDLDAESIAGVLSEQNGAWFYHPNLGEGRLGPVRTMESAPSTALSGGRTQLLDLAGDGQVDLVSFDGPVPGFFERTTGRAGSPGEAALGGVPDGGWAPLRTFRSLPALDWADPNLRFADLNGDGHADVLLARGDGFVWYPSLGEEGFGPGIRIPVPADEAAGPRLVFADGMTSVHLADMSGDGPVDLVRVRNGEVCYWPNLGYGRFGARVVMDDSPFFDRPDLFDPSRLRLADLDGTGPTDLLYLGCEGIELHFNQLGNRWAAPRRLPAAPPVDDLASVSVVDLLGHGTACLVWSSPLPSAARRQVRYIDLMGTKPHLLTGIRNSLGAETVVSYASSTKFYLADRAAGTPWITRLPFPVHVVEKTETFDWINRNRFVTRYSYHHGYFDGTEREFRGFGRVDRYDTDHIAALSRSDHFPADDNIDAATQLPPVKTVSWFHTGAQTDRKRISALFADEYYPPDDHAVPGTTHWLLDDSPPPQRRKAPGGSLAPVDTLGPDAEREAYRALKGQLLRQEVYALDGTADQPHPYTVIERNYTVEVLQDPRDGRSGVFSVHPRETVTVSCERDPSDPRIAHELVLAVDPFGTPTHSVSIAYGRAVPPALPALPTRTHAVQQTTRVTETRTAVTALISTEADDPPAGTPREADAYRTPVPYDTQIFELTGTGFDTAVPKLGADWLGKVLGGTLPAGTARRLLSRTLTRFCADTLAQPLGWGVAGERGLTHEAYRMLLTAAQLGAVFGARAGTGRLTAAGYVQLADAPPSLLPEPDAWWAPSGTVRYAPSAATGPAVVAAYARRHFFVPRRFVDPFAAAAATTDPAGEYATSIDYDAYDLLPVEVTDPLGNRITAGERNATDVRVGLRLDYRVLAPTTVTDANRNRTEVCFDALGRIAATAVCGKPEDDTGDRLDAVAADLPTATVEAFWADPLGRSANPDLAASARALLGAATTRFVYDVHAYARERKATGGIQPPGVATIARERHVGATPVGGGAPSALQVTFGYSDGMGQEVQRKLPAEPDPLLSGPKPPRWVGSGWVVRNNKGKPVRQYEPFFTPSHHFEFAVEEGVSPILCYDPVGRVIATVHPNHTYDKVVFGPWHQETWDANDTAPVPDPAADPDVGAYIGKLGRDTHTPTWYARRTAGDLTVFGDLAEAENTAAKGTELHAGTPTLVCFDPLGRPILTLSRNRTPATAGVGPTVSSEHRTHVVWDIQGNQLEVLDCVDGAPGLTTPDADRLVARYRYDLAGTLLREESMEGGTRRQLADISGKPVGVWEVLDTGTGAERQLAMFYDQLRRPIAVVLDEGAGAGAMTVGRTLYGESAQSAGGSDPALANLRGQVWRVHDDAGIVTHTYDVQGNAVSTGRKLTTDYHNVIDWSDPAAVAMDVTTWTGRTRYDALNRPYEQTHPDGTLVQQTYNEAGLLEGLRATLAGDAAATAFVKNIDYNARGQRTAIEYGSGVTTTYAYDPDTFRLTAMNTRRPPTFTEDRARPDDARVGVQNLRYVYDPVGNITHIRDDAQPRVFRLNTAIEASNSYAYDAVYRLVEATGREHPGITNGTEPPTSWNDAPRANLPNVSDRQALARYRDRYSYDAAGNMTRLEHRGTDLAHAGWTRTFRCEERSAFAPPSIPGRPRPSAPHRDYNNRLSSTQVGAGTPEEYAYDARGNMLTLAPMEHMAWDYRDRLRSSSRQKVNSGVPETTYYVYDAGGERVRKVTDGSAADAADAKRTKERIYLGGFELYREFSGSEESLIRTTVHIMDGEQRIALVETRTDDAITLDDPDRRVIRYQHTNHLGSATVELDQGGALISYEELHSYGCTALSFARGGVPPKRYRYTGKERDEETGLAYHGARYFAPWLTRWISPDPAGHATGCNAFLYVRANPIKFLDPNGLQEAKPMTGAEREAWDLAERSGFDNRSVENLMAVYVEAKIPQQGILVRDTAERYATVRGSAFAANWEHGNYGSAIGHIAPGVIEAFGASIFGTKISDTAKNIAKMYALSALLGWAGARSNSISNRPSLYVPSRGQAPTAPQSTNPPQASTGPLKEPTAPSEPPSSPAGGEPNATPENFQGAPAPQTDFYGTSNGKLVPAKTPGGVPVQPHIAERMGNPPKGRREVSASEVDTLLERGQFKKLEYDIYGENAPPGLVDPTNPATWRPSVTLEVPNTPGRPQVVVNPETGKLVTVIVPTKTPPLR